MCNYVIYCYIPCKGLYRYTLQGVHTYTVIYSTRGLYRYPTSSVYRYPTSSVYRYPTSSVYIYCYIPYKECIHILYKGLYTYMLQGVVYIYFIGSVCMWRQHQLLSYLKSGAAGGEVSVN